MTVGVTACESFGSGAGSVLFVRSDGGDAIKLQKQFEVTHVPDSEAYLNFSKQQVLADEGDLLGNALLSRPGGFNMDLVATAVPPLRTMQGARLFVGSRAAVVDVSLDHDLKDLNALGLPTPQYVIRMFGGNWSAVGMREGLVGGWLPVLAIQLPDTTGDNRGGYWEVSYVAQPNATDQQPVCKFLGACRHLCTRETGRPGDRETNTDTSST